MTDNTKFLGFDKAQIPLLSLILAGFLTLAGMFYQFNANMNANHAETQADIHALHSRIDALNSRVDALDSAHRADMNALRSEISTLRSETNADIDALRADINALSVEVAETNARIENIERSLPAYASVDERLDKLEIEQARLDEIEREQARLNELIADFVNAE